MTSPPGEQDRAGQTLGDYQLIRRLGRGGMADVYLAQQTSLDRSVALKVLKPQLAEDASYIHRFHNEAKAAAALIHPNIVQVHEVGQHDGIHFIAQEYVAGKTLKQLLDQQGSLAPDRAVSILRQVAAALHKSHQLNIVHRDIKPENVLIDEEGVAKVADFGLAKQTSNDDLALTSVGTAMGTPYYMSPEQVQGQSVDSRSDVYSLGITAFQMLTGRVPFEGDTPMSVALKQVNSPAPTLGSINPELPQTLCHLIDTMLAKEPSDRVDSAADLARDLQLISTDMGADSGQLSAASSAAISEAERSATGSRRQAVEELTAALAKKRNHTQRNYRWLGFATACLVGAVLARTLIDPNPLAQAASIPVVPKKDSPRQQYFYATYVNTEEAWQGVLDYYPITGTADRQRYYALRAKTGLARWYLENGNPNAAIVLFDELANLETTERELRAIGISGLALCYDATSNLEKAADFLTDVSPFVDELDATTKKRLARLEARLKNAQKN